MNIWLFFFLGQINSYSHYSTELCSCPGCTCPYSMFVCVPANMAFLSLWDNSGWKGPQEMSSVLGSQAFYLLLHLLQFTTFTTFNWNSWLQVSISVHHLIHIWNCQRDRDGKPFSSWYWHDLNTSSPEANSTSLPLLNALFYLRYSYSSSCHICFVTIVKKNREKK